MFVSPHAAQFTQAVVLEQLYQQGALLSSDVPSRRVRVSLNESVASAPVFDLSGTFVGFLVKKETQSVIVPFETILPSLNAILQKKSISHPSLGISYLDLSHVVGVEVVVHRGNKTGALVTGSPAVRKGSPAARALLKEGDIITSVNGLSIDETHNLSERLLSFRANEKIIFHALLYTFFRSNF